MREASCVLGPADRKCQPGSATVEGKAELSRWALCASGQSKCVSRLAVCFTLCTKHPARIVPFIACSLQPDSSPTPHQPHPMSTPLGSPCWLPAGPWSRCRYERGHLFICCKPLFQPTSPAPHHLIALTLLAPCWSFLAPRLCPAAPGAGASYVANGAPPTLDWGTPSFRGRVERQRRWRTGYGWGLQQRGVWGKGAKRLFPICPPQVWCVWHVPITGVAISAMHCSAPAAWPAWPYKGAASWRFLKPGAPHTDSELPVRLQLQHRAC